MVTTWREVAALLTPYLSKRAPKGTKQQKQPQHLWQPFAWADLSVRLIMLDRPSLWQIGCFVSVEDMFWQTTESRLLNLWINSTNKNMHIWSYNYDIIIIISFVLNLLYYSICLYVAQALTSFRFVCLNLLQGKLHSISAHCWLASGQTSDVTEFRSIIKQNVSKHRSVARPEFPMKHSASFAPQCKRSSLPW